MGRENTMLNKNYAVMIVFLLFPLLGYASSSHIGRTRGFRAYNSTHWVRPYVNRNGIYHTPHLSANPYAGLHCRNDICI